MSEVTNLPLEAAAGTTPITAGPNNDHLAPFLGAPTYVAWDLTASGAANHGAVLGYGLLGVYWTAVRDVPQVLPGTPAGTTKPFADWSNKYDLTDFTWYQLPFTGPAPQHVIASTYIADTRSLYVVDQTDDPVLARLLRYDFDTGAFAELGHWPRTIVFDRAELSGSYEGNLLLSGSSKLTNHVAGVVLQPGAAKVELIGAFLRKRVLAVEPTLGATALTLPLVPDSSSGSTNTVIPTKQVFFPTHEKPQHSPKGPPCND